MRKREVRMNNLQIRTCACRRIAEAFQIFKFSKTGVCMGARGAPCTVTKVTGKLRKSKNLSSRAGGYMCGLQISLLLVCVGINFVITFKHAVDVL